MKIAGIIIVALIVIVVAMRMIRTKKEGEIDASGHTITDLESENSNLLFLALNKIGIK